MEKTLEEYLSSVKNKIDFGDYINLDRMEKLFKNLHNQTNNNGNKYIYLTVIEKQLGLNNHYNILNKTSEFIDYIIENTKNDKIIMLATNPDFDFPPPKENYLNIDKNNFKLMEDINNMPYKNKLDASFINKLIKTKNIHYFGYSIGNKDNQTNNIHMLPLGRDIKAVPYYGIVNDVHISNKTQLCYYNCTLPPDSFHWYGRIREILYEFCKNQKYINAEYCLKNPRPLCHDMFNNYFNNLKKSKFMLCPRGCGIDTYRMWDCLYMGCIPIIVKYDGYKDFEDLPILFLNDEGDYFKLTEELLENTWNIYCNTKWNYEKLKMSYWTKEINEF